MIFFEDSVTDFLRANLTDYNSTNRVGSEWIFPGFPWDLSNTLEEPDAFPRISVENIDTPKELVGAGANDLVESATVQITVFVHEDNLLDVNGINMGQQELARQIASDIEVAFKNNWNTSLDLQGLVHDFRINRSAILPPEPAGDVKLYKYEIDIALMGID